MIQVGLLTDVQKDELIGQMYDEDSYFNPIQDLNNKWIISVEEIEQCVNPIFIWVKELPLIPFDQKQNPPIE
jgi:hypothetical protein